SQLNKRPAPAPEVAVSLRKDATELDSQIAGYIHQIDDQRALIARNIQHHLQTEFEYTLDLTDARKLGPDEDPIAAFLTDFKKGHCEYFAGAMTLMCQSLDIPARLVVGFKCDAMDYNNVLGGYYLVRQSNAHAWCEVYVGGKWETFDPTSGIEARDLKK